MTGLKRLKGRLSGCGRPDSLPPVRPGVRGWWDRFVGPGPSPIENVGTVGLSAIGMLAGDRWLPAGSPLTHRLLIRGLAADLWGGVWVNNGPAAVAWYERPGQGTREHLGFAVLHVAHPAAIAWLDHSTGRRGAGSAVRWTATHYGWMLAATATVCSLPRPARFPAAAVASCTGIWLDRQLGRSNAAPWFAPVYYAKLLIGHAAGSIWNRA